MLDLEIPNFPVKYVINKDILKQTKVVPKKIYQDVNINLDM